MKISVKDLKVGDFFKIGDLVEVYPVMCGCFDDANGKWVGYRKVTDDITEVDLIYRESDESED